MGISQSGNIHSRSAFYIDGIGRAPSDSTMPEKLCDKRDSAFYFGMDPGWYFSDEMETNLVVPLPETRVWGRCAARRTQRSEIS